MSSIAPSPFPERMVSSWHTSSSPDNNNNLKQKTHKTVAKKRRASTALNKAAQGVSESAHNIVDGAAHAAHHVLGRVLGHHRAEHDDL